MDNYALERINMNEYLIVCLDYDSVLNYLDEVENDLAKHVQQCELIVDQLLVSGNGKNRFISCCFCDGKIDLKTAKNLSANCEVRKISSEILSKYLNRLKYSILTDKQLDGIRQGQAI